MFKSAQETVGELWPSEMLAVLFRSPAYKQVLLLLVDGL